MENNRKFCVVNRSDTSLTIILEYPYVNKKFEGYGSPKDFTFGELKAMVNTRGGRIALKNYLQIIDEKEVVIEALNELGISVEEEYFYNTKIIKYLLNEGSLEQLEDTLNFAPTGVVELIKTLAIKLRIPDRNKIDLISEKTGSNIEMMTKIDVEQERVRKDGSKEETKTKRKSVPINIEEVENKTTKKTTVTKRKTSSKKLMEEGNNSKESDEL